VALPRFRTLAHVADVRLAVWGAGEEELLRNAVAGALTRALDRRPAGAPSRRHRVPLGGPDTVERVVRTVNEALFLLYARREVVVGVRLHGRAADLDVAALRPDRAPAVEVKAATFHDATVARGARLRVVLTLDL
jgi:SHS2 domain-containing protein